MLVFTCRQPGDKPTGWQSTRRHTMPRVILCILFMCCLLIIELGYCSVQSYKHIITASITWSLYRRESTKNIIVPVIVSLQANWVNCLAPMCKTCSVMPLFGTVWQRLCRTLHSKLDSLNTKYSGHDCIVHLKKWTLKFKLLHLLNHTRYLNKICRICALNTLLHKKLVNISATIPET